MVTICLLSYYPPGVQPVRKDLENGARLNPHGYGFAFPWMVRRELDNPGEVIDHFLAMRVEYPESPAVFHSRNATGDSPRTLKNAQPFWTGDMIVAHNGYLFPHDGERSDSVIFGQEILPRYDLDDPAQVELLEKRMGPNKAVILRLGRPALILNQDYWIGLAGGTWHSNGDWQGIPHVLPGWCPVCHGATMMKPVCLACEMDARERRALLMEPVI